MRLCCGCTGARFLQLADCKLPIPPHTQLLSALLYAQSMLSVACVLAVNFEVYTLSNSDNVCDECCVVTCTSDTHLSRLIVMISVMNSQPVSFRIPPKFIVYLPQSVLECGFNAQRCVRSCCEFRSVYTTSNSDNVCDECCVVTCTRTRISGDYSS